MQETKVAKLMQEIADLKQMNIAYEKVIMDHETALHRDISGV